MKKALVTLMVVALMGAVASADTTLHVWTTLVSATLTGYTSTRDMNQGGIYVNVPNFTYGTTPVPIGPNMATGYYGVQVWAEVLGGTPAQGLTDIGVTLYTPDTNNVFVPVMNPKSASKTGGVLNYNVVETYSSTVANAALNGWVNQVPAAYKHSSLGSIDPGTDADALQVGFGEISGGYGSFDTAGAGTPILLATEAWQLLSNTRATLAISATGRYWDGSGIDDASHKIDFTSASMTQDSLIIPEPFTMTMVGMGLCGLGMFIRRRVKETV